MLTALCGTAGGGAGAAVGQGTGVQRELTVQTDMQSH